MSSNVSTRNSLKPYQVISDLHLEKYRIWPTDVFQNIIPIANVLILAGDIGTPNISSFHMEQYMHFLQWCSERWKEIILIAGNHEYYGCGKRRNITTDNLSELSQKITNVHFLDRSTYENNGIMYVGTTLWTKIKIGHFKQMNDSVHTFKNTQKERNLHIKEREFIEMTIDQNSWSKNHTYILKKFKMNKYIINIIKDYFEPQIIIVTHHAPAMEMIPEDISLYADIPTAYASKILKSLNSSTRNRIKEWCCGHIHKCYNNILYGVQITSNPIEDMDSDDL